MICRAPYQVIFEIGDFQQWVCDMVDKRKSCYWHCPNLWVHPKWLFGPHCVCNIDPKLCHLGHSKGSRQVMLVSGQIKLLATCSGIDWILKDNPRHLQLMTLVFTKKTIQLTANKFALEPHNILNTLSLWTGVFIHRHRQKHPLSQNTPVRQSKLWSETGVAKLQLSRSSWTTVPISPGQNGQGPRLPAPWILEIPPGDFTACWHHPFEKQHPRGQHRSSSTVCMLKCTFPETNHTMPDLCYQAKMKLQ